MESDDNIRIVETWGFRKWLDALRDRKARIRIDDRLKRLAAGNVGDTRSVAQAFTNSGCILDPDIEFTTLGMARPWSSFSRAVQKALKPGTLRKPCA